MGPRHQRDSHDAFGYECQHSMKKYRHGENDWSASNDVRNTANSVPKEKLVGPGDGQRPGRDAIFTECYTQYPDEVSHGETANVLLAHPDERKERKCAKRLTEMIEHVITAPVNNAGLENREVQTRGAHDFLGGPF